MRSIKLLAVGCTAMFAGVAHAQMGNPATTMAQADTNHDGRVSRSELAVAPTPVFDCADTNHDGFVDRNELAAVQKRGF